MCLHLLGRNVMQADAARIAGCNQTTAGRILRRFLNAMCKRAASFIHWPGESEREAIQLRVFSKHHLPGIVGFIDGTHVRILAPVNDKEDFMNRKKFHSINVGAVCDDSRLIRWISVSWPGSAHDSRVLKTSQLYKDMQEGRSRGIIIGDSAYAAERFLIKPLDCVTTSKEIRYNAAISSARSSIECAFGILKRRFHIMHSECRNFLLTRIVLLIVVLVLAERLVILCCLFSNVVMVEPVAELLEKSVSYVGDSGNVENSSWASELLS